MKRRNNKRGFTLAELLIVVAIVAVLVAISIPVFSSQLEKSREQTDIANLRAAKAAAIVATLDQKIEVNGKITDIKYETGDTETYYYDAIKGTFVLNPPSVGYGKGTVQDGGCDEFVLGTTNSTLTYKKTDDAQNKVLKCVFTKALPAVTTGRVADRHDAIEPTYQLSWEDVSTGG